MPLLELPAEVSARYYPQLSKQGTIIGPLIHIPTLTCPSDANDTTGTGNISTCPLCDSGEDSDELGLDARWFFLGKRDGESCSSSDDFGDSSQISCTAASLTKRDFEYYQDDAQALERRLNDEDQEITIASVVYEYNYGGYPPCSEVKAIGDTKKYSYGPQNTACDATVTRAAINQVNPCTKFQSKFFLPRTLQPAL